MTREGPALLCVSGLKVKVRLRHCGSGIPLLRLTLTRHGEETPGEATGIWFCYILFTIPKRNSISIQDQMFGPLLQLPVRKIYPATEETSKTTETGLKSPVREELFHFLRDWQC